MRKKLKIAQITPGLMEITRAEKWGAIERVIYHYKQSLERLGHTVDIKYLNEIDPNNNPYDIINVHVANLLLEAKQRGFNAVYSIHDHHIMISDDVYRYNREAINNSAFTIVHGNNILEKFKDTNKCKYLRHGVNTEFFKPDNREKKYDLLCVANNGLNGDPTVDRKGFRLAIECAKELGLSITIAGPENNLKFFDANKDLLEYNKLKILTDLNEEELLSTYRDHKIFVHLSYLEGGHPNLTLLEAIACGLPVVGTLEDHKLLGMIITQRNKEEVCEAINKILSYYNSYSTIASEITAPQYSWNNVAKELELLYLSEINRNSMKKSLDKVYSDLNVNTNVHNKIMHSFNNGATLEIIGSVPRDYNVKFIDRDTGNIVYNTTMPTNNWTRPLAKYYVNWEILVNDSISYPMDLEGENVLIHLDSKALGDTLAWMPYCEEFRKKHNCNLSVSTFWNELFPNQYPEIIFRSPGISWDGFKAYYEVGCIDNDVDRNKNNWRTIPLQQVASDYLGLEFQEIRPKINTFTGYERATDKKYVAITHTATIRAKMWNHPHGWEKVIKYLKDLDYEVLILQKEDSFLPNALRRIDVDIKETIFHLSQAEFYIGLGSGVSWLAWALGLPVVLISGFSQSYTEFYTPYRVINTDVCYGCYNDIKHEYNRGSWNHCPRKKNFICTSSITTDDVINRINRIIYKEN